MSFELYMQRCLDLAGKGFPGAIPNPLVGCVIVKDDKVIGEGYHREYGQAHAEVNAITSVEDDSLLPGSTLFVNLEPCNHFGKTPPCTGLIISKKIGKVVVAAKDPNPVVSGRGIEKLRSNGTEVICGILENEAMELNKRFYTFHRKQRPYIIFKWAQTKDGFIADEKGCSQWISNKYSRLLVHRWRTEEMAIMAGTTTIEKDNPRLTARDWPGNNPARVVIDKDLQLPAGMNVFNNDATVFVFNKIKQSKEGHLQYIKSDFGKNFIPFLVQQLYENNIQSLLVEGGCKLLQSFINEQLWDEARIFISEKTFGSGIKAIGLTGSPTDEINISGDTLRIYRNYSS